MANQLVFDLETIPDVEFGRRFYDLPRDLSDREVALQMQEIRREEKAGATDFLKHAFHSVCCISGVFRDGDKNTLSIFSLYQPKWREGDIIAKFFEGIDTKRPTLVSWNGQGFDAPVMHYRALKFGVQSKVYWDKAGDAKWSNYTSRYHDRHLDLMDVLASYNRGATATLDEASSLIGLPGKQGIGGAAVSEAYFDGKHEEIRQYCEIDVVNTYLVHLRLQLIRGLLTRAKYEEEVVLVKTTLRESGQAHLQGFLDLWEAA